MFFRVSRDVAKKSTAISSVIPLMKVQMTAVCLSVTTTLQTPTGQQVAVRQKTRPCRGLSTAPAITSHVEYKSSSRHIIGGILHMSEIVTFC